MEKELYDLLNKQGEAALAKELKFDDITLDDFIAKHKDELLAVPGYIDLMQPKESKAPLGMTEEQKAAYFYDDPEGLKNYEQKMQQVGSDLSDRQKLAEEYKRGKEWSMKVGPFELANEQARHQYEMGNTKQAVANEIAGKVAGVLDFAPYPLSIGGPLIRTTQKWAADEPVATGETGVDWVTGVIPFGKYAREGYQAIRGLAGKAGSVFDKTALGESAKKTADAMDKALLRKEAAQKASKAAETVGAKSVYSVEDIAKIAADVPELRGPLMEFWKSPQTANDLAKLRKTADDIMIAKRGKINPTDTKISPNVPRDKVLDEVLDASIDAANISKSGKALVNIAGTAGIGAVRKTPRYVPEGSQRRSEQQKEYDKAIQATIDLYKRQWQAGFKPNEGFELEAYNAWVAGGKK